MAGNAYEDLNKNLVVERHSLMREHAELATRNEALHAHTADFEQRMTTDTDVKGRNISTTSGGSFSGPLRDSLIGRTSGELLF